jgi:rhodanese-related sulfurtransferase
MKARQLFPDVAEIVIIVAVLMTFRQQAVSLLEDIGYKNIRHYVGGMVDWVKGRAGRENGCPCSRCCRGSCLGTG